jgi:hypothetical protein
MSEQRIRRLVFWLDGALVAKAPDGRIQPGLAGVLDELIHRFELWLVSDYPAEPTAAVIAENGLSRWFDDESVFLLPQGMADQQQILDALVTAGVIVPGESLLIDNHPTRTLLAVRQGIDASIFVDARRFRRDLVLWRIVADA